MHYYIDMEHKYALFYLYYFFIFQCNTKWNSCFNIQEAQWTSMRSLDNMLNTKQSGSWEGFS